MVYLVQLALLQFVETHIETVFCCLAAPTPVGCADGNRVWHSWPHEYAITGAQYEDFLAIIQAAGGVPSCTDSFTPEYLSTVAVFITGGTRPSTWSDAVVPSTRRMFIVLPDWNDEPYESIQLLSGDERAAFSAWVQAGGVLVILGETTAWSDTIQSWTEDLGLATTGIIGNVPGFGSAKKAYPVVSHALTEEITQLVFDGSGNFDADSAQVRRMF